MKKMRDREWPRHLPEEMRPQIPLSFDYVLPVSAKLGDVDEVKKALVRVYRSLNPPIVPKKLFDDVDKTLL